MSNILPKLSTSGNTVVAVPPLLNPEKVVASFTLATSQLMELIGECKDSGKKTVEISRQMNGIEDRMTSLEQKAATTSDLGKAMGTLREELAEVKKQQAATLEELKILREDREPILKEVFAIGNTADHFRTTFQGAITGLVKGVGEALWKLESQVAAPQGVIFEKK
jgi:hypothetical protein